MQLRDVYPLICLSGQGRAFWPVSRKAFPRQLSRLTSGRSPFQIFLQGTRDMRLAEPVLVAERESLFLIEEQLREISMPSRATILEPLHRGSAASICAATELVAQKEPDALFLIILSENMRIDQEALREALTAARPAAQDGQLVLFGQRPAEIDPSRDYIELVHGAADAPVAQAFAQFISQPDRATAEAMHETDRYLWSADLVLASAKTLRAAFGRHSGSTRAAVRRALREGSADRGIYGLGPSFSACDTASFAEAILQHEEGSVVALANGARNMNSWRDFWREAGQDENGVAIKGSAVATRSRNSLLHNTVPGIHLVGLGLDNVVGIVTPDAVLIADMDAVDDLSATVDQLESLNLTQVTEMPTQTHSWGRHETLDRGNRHKIRMLELKPGRSLPLERHANRTESYQVLEGTARLVSNGELTYLSEGETGFVRPGEAHTLENPGRVPVRLLQVIVGAYLGDDDVENIEEDAPSFVSQ